MLLRIRNRHLKSGQVDYTQDDKKKIKNGGPINYGSQEDTEENQEREMKFLTFNDLANSYPILKSLSRKLMLGGLAQDKQASSSPF